MILSILASISTALAMPQLKCGTASVGALRHYDWTDLAK